MWRRIQYCVGMNYGLMIIYKPKIFLFCRMFFVLHANVCGTALPHHGHSHGGGHDHSHNHHGHSHDESPESTDASINAQAVVVDIINEQDGVQVVKRKKQTKNLNVRAAIIHVIGDFVQSVGVLCAAVLIHFKV